MSISESRPLSRKKRIIFFFITLLIFIFLLVLCWLGWSIYRTSRLYDHIKVEQPMLYNREYKADPLMGFAYFQDGRILENKAGNLEIPVNPPDSSTQRPLVLALGGSFTYGHGCNYRETYPYLVGAGLGGTSLNAGLNCGGLSQMVILARRLIPKYKPDYVLAQYTPWLTGRSMYPFIRTDIYKIPVPFFGDSQDGKVTLCPPVYMSKFFDIPLKYRNTPPGSADYLSFLIKVGLPIYAYQDLNMTAFYIKRLLGKIPTASKDRAKIVETAYSEIKDVCRKNGAKMIIVFMGGVNRPQLMDEAERLKQVEKFDDLELNRFPEAEVEKFYGIKDAVIADTRIPLFEKLDTKNYESYSRAYHQWKGSPPVCYDQHPNPAAHEMIADEILKVIKREEQKKE